MMFDGLIEKYIQEFHKNGEPVLKTIANLSIPSQIVMMKYKDFPPLETTSEENKRQLWDYANEIFPDETQAFKIRFCKIVYTIGSMLNE